MNGLRSHLGKWFEMAPGQSRRLSSLAGNGRKAFSTRSWASDWPVPAFAFAVACVGLALGMVSLATTAADGYATPVLGLLAVALGVLALSRRTVHRQPDRTLDVLTALAAGSALLLPVLPQYVYPTNEVRFYAIIHRSVFSALLLIGVSLPAACSALFHLFGGTPGADDISRYPLLIFPVLVALGVYGLILWNTVTRGLPVLIRNPSILWTTYLDPHHGLATHILGTLVLTALTAAISLPIGVGTGVYLAEYGTGPLGQWVATTTTALRSISVFILGLGAYNAVHLSRGTFLSDLISGYHVTAGGSRTTAEGTYVTAAFFLSLLVIPIIARSAEEGCRAVPRDLREGSWALAASEAYTLSRVVLPWAWPNIITGLLIGCMEAAGDVAVIMFVAGTLDEPFRLLNQPTSLAVLIYERYQLPSMAKAYPSAELIALLLVLITMILNGVALILKSRFAARYRGNQ